MNPLAAGAQVDGLLVQRVLSRNTRGFTYLVSDPAINTVFELQEYAPTQHAARDPVSDLIAPLPGHEASFEHGLRAFLKEGRLLAQLKHPNLDGVLRFLEARGTAYQLKPHHAGDSLAGWVAEHDEAAEADVQHWLRPLLEALDHLHESGVIHQDITPDNLWINDNNQPILRGLARAARGAESGLADISDPYKAPEQAREEGEFGPWTDSYGLGASLYFALCGAPPETAAKRSKALDKGLPDPLSEQGPLQARGLSGLTETLLQSLELDPAARPQSLPAWRESLDSLDWRLKVATQAPAAAGPTEKRQRLPLLLGGLIAIALLAMAVYLLSGNEGQLEDFLDGAGQQTPADSANNARRTTDVERARWEAALDADTLLGYRSFLQDFPDSVYAPQAQLQINVIDERLWQKLSSEDTRSAYEDYLNDFPLGLHQAEALQRIEAIDAELARQERERIERERQDNAAWAEARQERSIASMDRYINEWPAGLHIEEAQQTRRALRDARDDNQAFATAQQLDSKKAFQAYLDRYPQGVNVAAALEAIERLTLTPGKVFRDCPLCPEMRVMPLGTFRQGAAPDDPLALEQEKPARIVTLSKPFAIGVFEVTMGQWDTCVEAGACTHRPPDNGWGRGDRPVMMVSWNDVQEYTAWLSETTGQVYRLPSESEWEYVARADELGSWIGGDRTQVCQHGNIAGSETGFSWQHEDCSDPVVAGTVPVGAFRPNKAGIFDTTGNVAEWTADCLNLSYLDAPVDGSAWTKGICSSHMARGGSWVTGTRDIRLPARFNLKNGDRNDFTGFRVLREIHE